MVHHAATSGIVPKLLVAAFNEKKKSFRVLFSLPAKLNYVHKIRPVGFDVDYCTSTGLVEVLCLVKKLIQAFSVSYCRINSHSSA